MMSAHLFCLLGALLVVHRAVTFPTAPPVAVTLPTTPPVSLLPPHIMVRDDKAHKTVMDKDIVGFLKEIKCPFDGDLELLYSGRGRPFLKSVLQEGTAPTSTTTMTYRSVYNGNIVLLSLIRGNGWTENMCDDEVIGDLSSHLFCSELKKEELLEKGFVQVLRDTLTKLGFNRAVRVAIGLQSIRGEKECEKICGGHHKSVLCMAFTELSVFLMEQAIDYESQLRKVSSNEKLDDTGPPTTTPAAAESGNDSTQLGPEDSNSHDVLKNPVSPTPSVNTEEMMKIVFEKYLNDHPEVIENYLKSNANSGPPTGSYVTVDGDQPADNGGLQADEPADNGGLQADEPADNGGLQAADNGGLQADEPADDGGLQADEPADNGGLQADEPADDGGLQTDKPADNGGLQADEPADNGGLQADEPADDGGLQADEPADDGGLQADEPADSGGLQAGNSDPEPLPGDDDHDEESLGDNFFDDDLNKGKAGDSPGAVNTQPSEDKDTHSLPGDKAINVVYVEKPETTGSSGYRSFHFFGIIIVLAIFAITTYLCIHNKKRIKDTMKDYVSDTQKKRRTRDYQPLLSTKK